MFDHIFSGIQVQLFFNSNFLLSQNQCVGININTNYT